MSEELKLIGLDEIVANDDWNCRIMIIPHNIQELAASIKDHGLKQPVVVIPKDGEYKLIMGYRRYHAHKLLARQGHSEFLKIKAMIDDSEDMTEDKAKILNLTENLHRKDLNMLEEARALEYFKDRGYNRADTAAAVGMSSGWVQERFMLLDLPDDVQMEAAMGWISSPILRDLYSIFKKNGNNAGYEALRKAKEAKKRGEKVSLVKRKTDPLTKKVRKPPEIRQLRDFIYDNLGPEVYSDEGKKGSCWLHSQMAVRVLAFILGDISEYELKATLKTYADRTGNKVEMPTLEY
jgi:ParB family chromosome partitioning protein